MGKILKKRFFVVFVIYFLVINAQSVFSQETDNREGLDDYIRQGWSHVEAGDLNKATASFQKGVELEPDNIKALEGLAWCYLYTDRLKRAEELYQRILTTEPHHVAAQLGLAKVYSFGGRHKESIDQYEQTLAEDPRNIRTYKGMAQVYSWDNRLKESVTIYQNALKLAEDDVELRLGLAKVYGWMGDWSKAEGEYEKILVIDPRHSDALKGIEEARAARQPYQRFRFQYTTETDAFNFKAHTLSYGYTWTQPLDGGNEIFAAYYFDDFRETGKTHALGNIAKLGGRLHATDRITIVGSTDIRAYSPDPDFFAGGSLDMIIKYYKKNTFALKYARELFDVLDEIKGNRYGGESKIYLHDRLVMTNSYSSSDYSDENRNEDWYHSMSAILFKGKPDLSFTIGYRMRGFKKDAPQYYSPPDLDSAIYSLYLGGPIGKTYTYGNIKLIDNSDQIDNYYFLGGSEYPFNKDASFTAEVSYFDTTEKYHALTATMALRTIF